MAWRREVWAGTESWDEEEPQEEEEEDEAAREAEPREQAPEVQPSSAFGAVTQVRIRLKRWKEVPPTPENDYVAEIIKDGDEFHYRAIGATVPISEFEAQAVVDNPFLYYFSTALKLHVRIENKIKGQVGEEGVK